MQYRYLTQVPYDTHPIKTSAVPATDSLDYLRYLSIEQSQLAWIIKQERLRPLQAQTVLDLQADLLSTIGVDLCQCLAYTDASGQRLTNNARRYWRTFTWEKTIAPAHPNETFKYKTAGLIGSLAFYNCLPGFISSGSTDLDLVKSTLAAVWADLASTQTDVPVIRIQKLLTSLDFKLDYIQASAAALTQYLAGKIPAARLAAIDPRAVNDLPLRLLLGEVTDELISIWSRFQLMCNRDPTQASLYGQPINGYQQATHLLQVGLTVGRGGGWALIFQALYLENLVKVYELLDLVPSASIDLTTQDPNLIATRAQIALHYAAAADAQSVLARFNTIEVAQSKAQALWHEAQRWQATVPSNYTTQDSGWRLSNLLAGFVTL
jgi:hypothetical protein